MLLPGRCSHRPACNTWMRALWLTSEHTIQGPKKDISISILSDIPTFNGLHYKGVICFFGTLIMQSSLGA